MASPPTLLRAALLGGAYEGAIVAAYASEAGGAVALAILGDAVQLASNPAGAVTRTMTSTCLTKWRPFVKAALLAREVLCALASRPSPSASAIPLAWHTPLDDLTASWCRALTLGVDPVVPGMALEEELLGVAAVARDAGLPVELATGSSRLPVDVAATVVCYMTHRFVVWQQADGGSGSCEGFAFFDDPACACRRVPAAAAPLAAVSMPLCLARVSAGADGFLHVSTASCHKGLHVSSVHGAAAGAAASTAAAAAEATASAVAAVDADVRCAETRSTADAASSPAPAALHAWVDTSLPMLRHLLVLAGVSGSHATSGGGIDSGSTARVSAAADSAVRSLCFDGHRSPFRAAEDAASADDSGVVLQDRLFALLHVPPHLLNGALAAAALACTTLQRHHGVLAAADAATAVAPAWGAHAATAPLPLAAATSPPRAELSVHPPVSSAAAHVLALLQRNAALLTRLDASLGTR